MVAVARGRVGDTAPASVVSSWPARSHKNSLDLRRRATPSTPVRNSAIDLLVDVIARDGQLGTSRCTDLARLLGLDLRPLWDRGYAIALVPAWIGNGRGDLSRDPTYPQVFAIEVRDGDDDQVVDVVFVDPARPDCFGTALGRGHLLDLWTALAPATYAGGRPLRLHRSPLGWIRGGCRGAALLERDQAWDILPDLPGPVLAEDRTHGMELARLTRNVIDPARIRIPTHG